MSFEVEAYLESSFAIYIEDAPQSQEYACRWLVQAKTTIHILLVVDWNNVQGNWNAATY